MQPSAGPYFLSASGVGDGCCREPGWAQGGCAASCGQGDEGSLAPQPFPRTASPPPRPQPLCAMQVPTCDIVGDPAVPAPAAVLEAAVPGGQDIQVLLAQQGKAPAWKRRSHETGTEPGAKREGGSSSSRQPLLTALPGAFLCLARKWAQVSTNSFEAADGFAVGAASVETPLTQRTPLKLTPECEKPSPCLQGVCSLVGRQCW